MKYISKHKWRRAEEEGNFTDATKLLLYEIKCNCKRVPVSTPEYEILQDFYSRFMYINNLSVVPRSTFYEIKDVRKEVKEFINKL